MIAILGAALLLAPMAPAQSTQFYSDGENFVYRETQSCAWYVDQPEDAMLRLSYRNYSGEVFFAAVGGPWNIIEVGEMRMVSISTDKTGLTRHAFITEGFIQPGDDNRRGLAGRQGEELLSLLRSAQAVTIFLDNGPQATYQLTGMDVAMDKLKTCSRTYFNTAPASGLLK